MTKEDVEARAARVVAESGPLSAAEEKEIKTQLRYLYSHSKCNMLRKISNRISAQNSRMKTISYIEGLQMKVAELTEQNTALRMRVQQLEHPQHFSRSPVALAVLLYLALSDHSFRLSCFALAYFWSVGARPCRNHLQLCFTKRHKRFMGKIMILMK